MRGYSLIQAFFSILLLAGCDRGVQTTAAVRQGVIDHLSSRSDLNIASMQVEVTSVSFRQNEADATVSFRPKGTAAGQGMQMRYTLERKGNRWVVKSKSEAGAGTHGGGMGQPKAPGEQPAPGSDLPAGHPPVGKPKPGTQK